MKTVAVTGHVGGRVVDPKPGACADSQNPPLDNVFWKSVHCLPLTLLPLHNAPTLLVEWPVSYTSIGSVGAALPCSSGGHPGVGAGE